MKNYIRHNNARNITLDAMAGMFIFLMTLQHFNILTMKSHTIGHIFMFNTILFFWKAGMFHRPQSLSQPLIKKLTKKFIVPFVVLIPVTIILYILSELIKGTEPNICGIIYSFMAQTFHNGAPWWNIPLWFLLTFFFVKIITCNYTGKYTLIFTLICLSLGAMHHFTIGENFNYIGNTAIATLFYILGYRSKDINLNNGWFVLLGILFISVFFLMPCAFDIYGNKPRFGNYFLSIIMSIVGIILFNKALNYLKFLHITPLIFIGQNAIVFLIFHVPIAMFIRNISHGEIPQEIIPYLETAISLPLCFLICLFFDKNKKFSWIIGK